MLAKIQSWFARKSPNHARQIRFAFDGHTISADGPFARKSFVRVEDIREIGIETTNAGPFLEDVFWLINREADCVRIPQDSPVFKVLMDYFGSFEGFDWRPFTGAMSCTDPRYFLCWQKQEPARPDLI